MAFKLLQRDGIHQYNSLLNAQALTDVHSIYLEECLPCTQQSIKILLSNSVKEILKIFIGFHHIDI